MENQLFPITVDFSLSLDEMIRAGNYFHVNLTPLEIGQPKQYHSGVKEVNIECITFDQDADLVFTLDTFEKRGFRPANLPEFLALGAQHPLLQKKSTVITLDGVVKRNFVSFNAAMDVSEDRLVPCLLTIEDKRILYWGAFDGQYRPGFLFACVRK